MHPLSHLARVPTPMTGMQMMMAPGMMTPAMMMGAGMGAGMMAAAAAAAAHGRGSTVPACSAPASEDTTLAVAGVDTGKPVEPPKRVDASGKVSAALRACGLHADCMLIAGGATQEGRSAC